jgi:hypothetical protein
LLSLELQKPVPVSGFCVLQSPQAPSLIVTREADKVFAASSSSSLHHKLVGFVGFFFFLLLSFVKSWVFLSADL